MEYPRSGERGYPTCLPSKFCKNPISRQNFALFVYIVSNETNVSGIFTSAPLEPFIESPHDHSLDSTQ
jgi:hypothetical protein